MFLFRRKFFWAGLLAAAVFSPVVRAKTESAAIAYQGAIVTDAATGRVLFEDNADVVNPPASMAKLMTFAVLHDTLAGGSLTLQTPVRITAEDANMGGTQVYLDPRETFPVEELIYAMMIQSANDAAHALARASAGSVEAFVALMNAKARSLGMAHTTFRTPHGLPPPSRRVGDGDLTSPRDYALLCRYLVAQTDVLKYSSIRNRDFGAGRQQGPQQMKNHNNLLGKVAGVDGLKTGYTASAGYCLSATAERQGRRVIVVVMGSLGPNGQKDLGKTRDLKTVELIERGFAALPAAAQTAPTIAGSPDPASPPGSAPTLKTAPVSTNQPEQTSTAADASFTFRVIPPDKKP
jgi:D-alanyl-D-alanine carboxypeptidase